MKVHEILPRLKANRYTYHNISKQDEENFKDQYKYLLRHKDKSIYTSCINPVNDWLNKTNELDYLKKIRAIQIISININHDKF